MKMKALLLSTALLFGTFAFSQTSDPKPKCIALTKKGVQCKNNAQENSKYCKLHDPATPRCGFIKKDGKPCQMMVKNPGEHCRFHS